jgi:3-oxoacyl-[acyl-carrier-protein] synthase-3
MATILRSSKDYRKPIGSHFRLHPVACTIKLVGATAGRALRRRVNALASVEERRHYVVQDGPAVYKAAVIGMAEVTEEILKRNDMTAADLARLVPHQANRRIIEAVAKRLGLGLDRVIINLDCYGNTVAPTVPIALSEWNERDGFAHGDRVVLSAFGAGFTAGSVFLRWATV